MADVLKTIHLYRQATDMGSEVLDLFFKTGDKTDALRKRREHIISRIRAQRNSQACQLALLAQSAVEQNTSPIPKAIKTRQQSSCFWTNELQDNGEAFFQKHLRICHASFDALSSKLQWPYPKRHLGEPGSKYKRLAIALYALGSASEGDKEICSKFAISGEGLTKIVDDFCFAAWKALWPQYLKNFPLRESKIDELIAGFEEIGLPQCLGVVDCCKFQITPPKTEPNESCDAETTILLALVDARGQFVYVNVGCPATYPANEIFHHSQLKRELDVYCQQRKRLLGGVAVPLYVLGSGDYILSKNMMKPYPQILEGNAVPEELFNSKASSCSQIAIKAFAQLIGRFRRLSRVLHNHNYKAIRLIRTCCVLHNFLLQENDTIDEVCFNEVPLHRNHSGTDVVEEDRSGAKIRDALSKHLGSSKESSGNPIFISKVLGT